MVAIVLLSACTAGDDGGAPVPAASVIPAATVPSPTPAGPFEPGAEVLTVAIEDPGSLDPMRLQNPGSFLVARQLFEGLTRWDPVAEKVRPAAAESWSVSDDGTTFTFQLRPGMSYHDGSPVSASDFVFAFDRIALKGNASDLAYTLERVEGFARVNQLGDARHLSGLSSPDDSTLVMRLSEPFYELPVVLTHPALVPLSPSKARARDFLSFPIGNGPFRMAAAWSPGDPVLLESFPGFIDTPELDGIQFLTYPDAAASWLPFLAGDIDVAEVPAGQIEAAEEAFGDSGYQPFLAGYYYGLNLRSRELEDIRLRKAINRAIDRPTIAKTIYKETLEAPRGIVPRGIPGFIENVCAELCDHSPATARRLVRRMPAARRRVTIEYTRGQPHAAVARAVRSDLERVGLQVRLESYDFERFLRRLRDGKQSAYRLGWIAEYPVADAFLSALFESDSPDNHSGFSSAKVDRLLAAARGEPSDARRVQLYIEAEETILRSVPIVPIGSFVTHWAAQERVVGIRFDVTGGFDGVGVSVAPS